MALSKDEILIRIGMDQTQLVQQMNRTSHFVQHSLDSLGKKAIHLLKANVFFAIEELVRSAIPTAEEFWDKIYGTDPESMSQAQQALENIKKLRREVESSNAALQKQRADRQFKTATGPGQEAILEANLIDARAATDKAARRLATARATRMTPEAIGEAMRAHNDRMREQEAIENQLDDVRDKLSPDDLRSSVRRRFLGGRAGIQSLRSDIATARALGDVGLESEARTKLGAAILNQQNILGEVENPIMKAMQGLAGLPFLGGIKGAIDKTQAAQAAALSEALKMTTLRVIIEDVKE